MNKADLKNKTFNCVRTNKGQSIEDIPNMREHLLKQVAELPGAEMTETDTSFEFNNGQFIMKPAIMREVVGVLDCRPTFIAFLSAEHVVRIEYKDITITGNIIETTNSTYKISNL